MQKYKANLKIYDWNVTVIAVQKRKDYISIKKELKAFNVPKEHIKAISLDERNRGNHYYNLDLKASLVLLYKCNDMKTMIGVFVHEIHHIAYRMSNYLNLEGAETPAYIHGYITKKILPKLLYNYSNEFTCNG